MAASDSAALWDNLYYLYFAIAAIIGALVVGWLFYNMWKFRWDPDRPRPEDAPRAGMISVERGHPLWSYVMAGLIALIMFGLAFGTISAVKTLEEPPETGERVYHDVIGYQFGWKYNYTGAGGIRFQVLTPGNDQFVVPKDTIVVLNITSQDVWHNFAIPDFRMRVDAIPGTVNPLWFKARETGEFHNVCVVICGVNHAAMTAPMLVVEREEYDEWLEERSTKEFRKLEGSFQRTPARGTLVNATVSDAALDLSQTTIAAGRPVVLNVTNEASTPVTVEVGGNRVDIAAGATGYVYAVAPTQGQLQVTASGQARTLEVGS